MFYEIGVPKNFAKFTEKHLRFFNISANLRLDTLLKNLGIDVFFKNTYYNRTVSGDCFYISIETVSNGSFYFFGAFLI